MNRTKSIFGKTDILILGYMISAEGIRVCPDKILLIQKRATPSTGKQIQQHLGFFNYFREMIPGYSKLFDKLECLRYKKHIVWTPEYQAIYDKAFKILSSDLVLSYPDFNESFYVSTDAPNHGIGAVLYQVIEEKTRYISFTSRALSQSERGYGATKRELLGIVYALRKFRYYLYGKKFRLYTDHKALTYMHTQKDMNQMMQGWFEELLELDYEVIHMPGILHVLPDAISRIYDSDHELHTSPRGIDQESDTGRLSNILVSQSKPENQEKENQEDPLVDKDGSDHELHTSPRGIDQESDTGRLSNILVSQSKPDNQQGTLVSKEGETTSNREERDTISRIHDIDHESSTRPRGIDPESDTGVWLHAMSNQGALMGHISWWLR